ncbi:MAG: DOPA 4,5-dioxygenase family protein [Hyphomicrobiales bacterium]|nr:DOPA 4,5-dioxygenase family protein [Hyphomicrobiales bacterium]
METKQKGSNDPLSGNAPNPEALSRISSFHAHIYYDPAATRDKAERLRQHVAERFLVRNGSWHDLPVGPHPSAMFQISFAKEVFPKIVPWLMLNRLGLTILVHPNTDRPRDDHLNHALWMGSVLPLDASRLPQADAPEPPLEPNTQPHISPE